MCRLWYQILKIIPKYVETNNQNILTIRPYECSWLAYEIYEHSGTFSISVQRTDGLIWIFAKIQFVNRLGKRTTVLNTLSTGHTCTRTYTHHGYIHAIYINDIINHWIILVETNRKLPNINQISAYSRLGFTI